MFFQEINRPIVGMTVDYDDFLSQINPRAQSLHMRVEIAHGIFGRDDDAEGKRGIQDDRKRLTGPEGKVECPYR